MREILFRGKTVIGGDWRQGDLLHTTTGKAPMIRVHSENAAQNVMVDPSTVDQYTGLKDKNGNRIFEGDILCGAGIQEAAVVEFAEGGFTVGSSFLSEWLWGGKDGNIRLDEVEVISNIHDNPDMRKE